MEEERRKTEERCKGRGKRNTGERYNGRGKRKTGERCKGRGVERNWGEIQRKRRGEKLGRDVKEEER